MSAAPNRREKMINMGPAGQAPPPPFRPLSAFTGQTLPYEMTPVLTHEEIAELIAKMSETELSDFLEVLTARLSYPRNGTLKLRLEDTGPQKITVIKELRNNLLVDLKTAKSMADSAPADLYIGDAQMIRQLATRLRVAGATVTVS